MDMNQSLRNLNTVRSSSLSAAGLSDIQKFYVLPTQCIYVLCVGLRTDSDYFPTQHKLAGFYNRDIKRLLRSRD